MIAVDTFALMAIIGHEPEGRHCMAALEAEPDLVISAGTVAEALIVAGRRGVLAQMSRLIDGLGFEVIPVTAYQRELPANPRGEGFKRAVVRLGALAAQ